MSEGVWGRCVYSEPPQSSFHWFVRVFFAPEQSFDCSAVFVTRQMGQGHCDDGEWGNPYSRTATEKTGEVSREIS
ncbi:MAG: hypothetical protein HamCj_06590 [Candidatus Hamiltonella defensa (Ceratovacuna japonica)]